MADKTPLYIAAVQDSGYSRVHAVAPRGSVSMEPMRTWCGTRLTPYYKNLGVTKATNIDCKRCQRSLARLMAALPQTSKGHQNG